METSGSLRFLENPGGHCPCSTTPVGPDAPCGTKCDAPDAAPACVQDEGSRRLVISGLNHTTFDLAVYASQGGSPHRHARLASGCWPGFARRDSYPQGSNERFLSSSLFLLSQAFLTQGHHMQLARYRRTLDELVMPKATQNVHDGIRRIRPESHATSKVAAVGTKPTRGYPQRILSPHRLPFRHAGRSGAIIRTKVTSQRDYRPCAEVAMRSPKMA